MVMSKCKSPRWVTHQLEALTESYEENKEPPLPELTNIHDKKESDSLKQVEQARFWSQLRDS